MTIDTQYLDADGDKIKLARPALLDMAQRVNSLSSVSVTSIANLKLVDKTKFSRAIVLGYYAAGDGGGGTYYYDSSDTTSADNNGTIIVAADGGRWKLSQHGWVSVKQFGAKFDGSTNDYSAIDAAKTWLQANGGGTLRLPKGTAKLNTMLSLNPIGGVGWHNLIVQGEGSGVTVLDFSGCVAGSDGIAVYGWGGRFGIAGLTVKAAPAIGININKGEVRGGTSWLSRFFLHDVIVDGCGSDGVRMLQTYMGLVEKVESRNNTLIGFNMQGFHTSMTFTNCWAGGDAASPNGGNSGAGWFLNGMAYSLMTGCSADWNTGPGYIIENTAGLVLSACGAESNGQEGWLLRTSTANTSSIPSVSQGINGMRMDGCFAIDNSQSAPATYSNFIGVTTANSINAELSLANCIDSDSVGATVSCAYSGSAGSIFVYEHGNKFQGSTSSSGVVSRQNNSVVGRSALAQLSANQSVPTATDTALAVASLTSNRLQATISANAVVIPSGVNRVRVSAGVYWDTNSSGERMVRIVKNGSSFAGAPQQKSVPSGFTPQAVSSAVIEVAASDTIGVVVYQSSGGSLNVINNGSTFLSVEAVG